MNLVLTSSLLGAPKERKQHRNEGNTEHCEADDHISSPLVFLLIMPRFYKGIQKRGSFEPLFVGCLFGKVIVFFEKLFDKRVASDKRFIVIGFGAVVVVIIDVSRKA